MSGLRVWLPSVSFVASEMYPVLFEPSLLVKTPRHRRLNAYYPPRFFPGARRQQELCLCMPIPRKALRESSGAPRRLGNNLAHRQRGSSSSQSCCMASWALCTLSRMISYLLLLNEHKQTLDIGYSILFPHSPVLFLHLFFL